MVKLYKFKRKKTFNNKAITVLLLAIVFGSAIGIFLPENLTQFTEAGTTKEFNKNEIISGKAVVVDGDTLKINDTSIRLFGIDAPEIKQSCLDENDQAWECGKIAFSLLSRSIGDNNITCKPRDMDQYNRIVAVCRIDGKDINALMVREGFALAYRDYSSDYIDEEKEAKTLAKGLWVGKFEYPWNWRGINRYVTSDPVPNECKIKGNISSKGEKIYHVPSGEHYSNTRINPSNGERWFCSEQEAKQAGWRRSKV